MKKAQLIAWTGLWLLVLASSSTPEGPAPARRPVVVADRVLELLANEVNGYAAFNNLSIISTYHRTLGSDAISELLRRLEAKCRLYGLTGTKIHRVPVQTGLEYFFLQDFDGQVPTRTRKAEVRLVKPFPKLLTTAESAPSCLIQGSRAADLTAPVVFIGDGANPDNYINKDLKGKIALAGNALPEDIKELAIHVHRAAGLFFYFTLPHNSGDINDAVLDTHWSPYSRSGEPSTFGISLSTNQFLFLKALLDKGEEVVVHVKIETELKEREESVFEILDAAIPGNEFPDQEFWVWAHIDHPLPGAVDNGSGCALILEMARTLQALIDNGLLPAPRRTIRFLWLPHVTGLNMYLSLHPEKIGKIKGGISVDSVAIDQSSFSNYFALGKPSHSLPSYWTAVLESLAEHLGSRTNRDLLDYRNTDNLFSPEGSRDQFNIRFCPFNGFGDEMQSNDGTIGIPTITFSNIPVPPRHSQVNFLKYVDPTGLHRIAYLGSALVSVFGWTDAANVWRVVDEVYARGRIHLLQEAEKAKRALRDADPLGLAEANKQGRLLIKCGLRREQGMLASIRSLLPASREAQREIDLGIDQVKEFAGALTRELQAGYAARCRPLGLRPMDLTPTKEEQDLDRLVPKPAPGVWGKSSYFGDYYLKVLGQEKLDSFHLRPGFSYGIVGYTEAHNFIDGRLSILEIHQATAAELWSEGYPSEHDVTLTEVADYMRMLEAAGIITIEKREGKGAD